MEPGYWKALFDALPPELLCMIIVILALLKFLGSSLKSNREISNDMRTISMNMEKLATLVTTLLNGGSRP